MTAPLDTTPRDKPQHGRHTIAFRRLPLRLPSHRARIPVPASSTHYKTDTTYTPPPNEHLASRITTYSEHIRRAVGWTTARCAEEEDVAYEEETPADGRQGIEGCYGAEQVQRLWADEKSACAVSVLCAEYVSSGLISEGR